MVPVTISSRWEFRPSHGTPAIWVEGISQTLEPGVATKPRSAGAVMRAASPRAKVRDEGSTHWAGWLRSSLTRATRVPFSMAGPRSKWPSVALPEAPSPTLTVSVVRAVFAGALFEARVAASASVASRVTRVATQRSPPVVPEVVCAPEEGAGFAPVVVPVFPVVPVVPGAGAGALGVPVSLLSAWSWAPWLFVEFTEPGPTPGAGCAWSVEGACAASARHEASSATSIVEVRVADWALAAPVFPRVHALAWTVSV